MEQPSILGSIRTPTAGAEPVPPDRLTGLRSYSPTSPTEERSPDALSSASEATETSQQTRFTAETERVIITYKIKIINANGQLFYITVLWIRMNLFIIITYMH